MEGRTKPSFLLCITVILSLYVLQGVTLGLIDAISIYLTSFGATWKHLGTLSLAMYPFSFKLLWAPLLDTFYIRRIGRRETWLLPIQMLIGLILILLSFKIDAFLVQLRVKEFTTIILVMVFLTATQDICVDGWALTLFAGPHIIWQSIAQTIGQPLGGFLGSSFLLTFESANMTNLLLRQPLGIAVQPYGLFSVSHFVRFWGMTFLLMNLAIVILLYQQKTIDNTSLKHDESHLKLLSIYLAVIGLFKRKHFRQFSYVIISSHIGHAATLSMTYFTLISHGLITREELGLLTMPLIIIKISVPFLLTRTSRPLSVFARTHIIRLVVGIIIAIFIFFGHHLRSSNMAFYCILIVLLGLNDALIFTYGTARGGFFAQISDTRIGGTYYTLVSSLSNVGQAASSSLVLYTANWFSKENTYFILVGFCFVFGFIWIVIVWKTLHELQTLPIHLWHVTLKKEVLPCSSYQNDGVLTFDSQKQELSIVDTDTNCPSHL